MTVFTASIKTAFQDAFGPKGLYVYPWLAFYTRHFDDLCSISGFTVDGRGEYAVPLSQHFVYAITQTGQLFRPSTRAPPSEARTVARLQRVYAFAIGVALMTLHLYGGASDAQNATFRSIMFDQLNHQKAHNEYYIMFDSIDDLRDGWKQTRDQIDKVRGRPS